MTYVYLNYDNMKSVVKSISNYADDADSAKAAAAAINFAHHFVVDLSGIAGWDEKVQALRDKGKEIDDRVELAKHQNENGLTPKQGTNIAYYVPDGVDDTVNNVQNASWAMDDAKVIEDTVNGGGATRFDSPKYKAARERAERRAQDPAYAAAFVEQYGITDLLHMPAEAQIKVRGYESPIDADASFAANMISHASQVWSSDESKKKVNEINRWLNSFGNYGRATELNAVLQVDGMTYEESFLVELANKMDDVPWRSEWDSGGGPRGIWKDTTGKKLEGYSTDPMVGVLAAMRNTPVAAEVYLFPGNVSDFPENSTKTKEAYDRAQKIMNRHGAGNGQWTEYWAAVMAGASEAGRETVDSEHPRSDRAIRAALLTSAGVNWMGSATSISSKAQASMATTLANYAWSVDDAANRTKKEDGYLQGTPSKNSPTFEGLTVQPRFSKDKLANVIGAVSEDEAAYSKVVEAVGELGGNRIAYATERAANGERTYLPDAMSNNAGDQGFLVGAANKKIEKSAGDKDQRKHKIINTVADLTTFIPGLPSGTSKFVQSGFNYAVARAKDEGKSEAEHAFAANLKKAQDESDVKAADGSAAVKARLLCALYQGGGMTDAEKAEVRHQVPRLFDEDGNLDEANMTADVARDLQTLIDNPGGKLSVETQQNMSDAAEKYDRAYDAAHK
jgi:hypothetical protein